ncbi:MAG TPA: hypothetical protein PK048_00780 [Candidatus Absconditabacterales bacterium]|nr:hypothetical protein [Candidatus Absconditabacterales bacterium]
MPGDRESLIQTVLQLKNSNHNRIQIKNHIGFNPEKSFPINENHLDIAIKIGKGKNYLITNFLNDFQDGQYECFNNINQNSSPQELIKAIGDYLKEKTISYDFFGIITTLQGRGRKKFEKIKQDLIKQSKWSESMEDETIKKIANDFRKDIQNNKHINNIIKETTISASIMSEFNITKEKIIEIIDTEPSVLIRGEPLILGSGSNSKKLTDFLDQERVGVCRDFSNAAEHIFNTLADKYNIVAHMETIVNVPNKHVYNVIYTPTTDYTELQTLYVDYTNYILHQTFDIITTNQADDTFIVQSTINKNNNDTVV